MNHRSLRVLALLHSVAGMAQGLASAVWLEFIVVMAIILLLLLRHALPE